MTTSAYGEAGAMATVPSHHRPLAPDFVIATFENEKAQHPKKKENEHQYVTLLPAGINHGFVHLMYFVCFFFGRTKKRNEKNLGYAKGKMLISMPKFVMGCVNLYRDKLERGELRRRS